VKPVGHLDHRGEPVRQTKRPHRFGRQEDREAVRLKPPELAIRLEFGQMFADACLSMFVAADRVELIESRFAEGFQLRPADG